LYVTRVYANIAQNKPLDGTIVKSIIHATSQGISASIGSRLQTGGMTVVPFPKEAVPSLGPNSLLFSGHWDPFNDT